MTRLPNQGIPASGSVLLEMERQVSAICAYEADVNHEAEQQRLNHPLQVGLGLAGGEQLNDVSGREAGQENQKDLERDQISRHRARSSVTASWTRIRDESAAECGLRAGASPASQTPTSSS